nr:hypothetical protein [Mycobacterium uberis]
MTTSEIAVVLTWHHALKSVDFETLVALFSGDINISDSHGTAQSHSALRRWAKSVKTTAELVRI